MNFKKISLLLWLLTFSTVSFSVIEKNITNASRSINETIRSNIFSIDFAVRKNIVEHKETSSNTDFSSLDSRSDIVTHYLGLSYWRDISLGSFGLMLGAYAGGFYGEQVLAESDDYIFKSKDTYQGLEAGVGARLYYKFLLAGLETKAYLGVRSLKSRGTYFLRYENDSFGRSIELEYEEEASLLESSIGMSFTNKFTGYTSFFSIVSTDKEQDKLDVSALNKDGGKFTLDKLASFETESVSFSLGFAKSF
jgi:hypothetical protein